MLIVLCIFDCFLISICIKLKGLICLNKEYSQAMWIVVVISNFTHLNAEIMNGVYKRDPCVASKLAYCNLVFDLVFPQSTLRYHYSHCASFPLKHRVSCHNNSLIHFSFLLLINKESNQNKEKINCFIQSSGNPFFSHFNLSILSNGFKS